jgi:hypothetical protein
VGVDVDAQVAGRGVGVGGDQAERRYEVEQADLEPAGSGGGGQGAEQVQGGLQAVFEDLRAVRDGAAPGGLGDGGRLRCDQGDAHGCAGRQPLLEDGVVVADRAGQGDPDHSDVVRVAEVQVRAGGRRRQQPVGAGPVDVLAQFGHGAGE